MQYDPVQNNFLFLEEDLSDIGLPFPSPPLPRNGRQYHTHTTKGTTTGGRKRRGSLEPGDQNKEQTDNQREENKIEEIVGGSSEEHLRVKVRSIGPLIANKVKHWASKLQSKDREIIGKGGFDSDDNDDDADDGVIDICIRDRTYLDEILDSQYNSDGAAIDRSDNENSNNVLNWPRNSHSPSPSFADSQGTFLTGNKDLNLSHAEVNIDHQFQTGNSLHDHKFKHQQYQSKYIGVPQSETPVITQTKPRTTGATMANSGLLQSHNIVTTEPSETLQMLDDKLLKNLQTLIRAKQQMKRVQRPTNTVTVNKLRKRLTTIANKKLQSIKVIQKFIEEFSQWEEGSADLLNPDLAETLPTFGTPGNSYSNADNDTRTIVQMVNSVFLQDIKLQRNVAQTIKRMVDSLEYISLKESELHTDGKNYLNDYKKYNALKAKKGPTHLETVFSLERLATTEQVYNSLRRNFQRTISVTMRQQFQALSYEYYESSEALKFAATNSIKSFLSSLEAKDFNAFTLELETLRAKRETKQQCCDVKQRVNNSQTKWEELKTGITECNDSLLKEICEILPVRDSAVEERVNTRGKDTSQFVADRIQPSLNFKTGLDVTYMSETPSINEGEQQQEQVQVEERESWERTLKPDTVRGEERRVATPQPQLTPETRSHGHIHKSLSPEIDSKRHSVTSDYHDGRGLRDKNENIIHMYNEFSKATPTPVGNMSSFSVLVNGDGLHLSARTANLEENIWDQDE